MVAAKNEGGEGLTLTFIRIVFLILFYATQTRLRFSLPRRLPR